MPVRNIALLKEVRHEVRKDQRRTRSKHFAMNDWANVSLRKLFPDQERFDAPQRLTLGLDMLVTCNTTACIAGWASLLSGDKFLVDVGPGYLARDGVYPITYVQPLRGRPAGLPNRAQRLLGLTHEEGSFLFLVANEDALWTLNQFIKGKPLPAIKEAYGKRREARRALTSS